MKTQAARILVVEDSADTAALLRDLLEGEGYEVETAATGEAAFEALAVAPDIDLMVLDLMLPGMSGYEVIERLRAQAELSDLPILVLSARGSASARVRGLREGPDAYMTKPFLPEEIVARARTLVTRRLLARRTGELEALSRIAQAALTAPSPELLLFRLVEIVVEVFNADVAVIYMLDEARAELRPRAAVGLPPGVEPAPIPMGVGAVATAIAAREPVLISEGAGGVGEPLTRREAFRSLMVAPLVVAGFPIGVLEVACRTRRLGGRADRLLRIVADRAAVAIEHARLENEARELADVVRRIGEGVVVADGDDRIVFANRAFHEMIGASDSLVGIRWTDFLAGAQDVATLTAQMRAPSFQGEVLLLTRAGDPRPVLATLSAAERHDGGGIQRIGVFRDISREHELRFRVIREQKFRTLGSLAAGVAHNINNRLTPVLGWTEMLQERLGADKAIARDELKHALTVMPQGGRLTLHVHGEADRAVVSISDTGKGMSAEVQRLAFEPFFTTRSTEGGTGLGLSLAQEIVQRYRGTIALSSGEGAGTTFTLSFPSITAEAARTPAFLPTLEPLRILAVEDEPDVLDVLRAMLTGAGHTVVTAASGREALDLFEREAVDPVITDLGMPGMTGLALAKELKRRRAVPVLLLTGWADELDAATAPSVDLVVAKPFTRERLFEALAHTLPDRVRPA